MKKFLILIFPALLVIGCSNGQEAKKEDEQPKQELQQETKNEKNQEQEQNPTQVPQGRIVNEELTKKLEEEKTVSKGNVYEKDDVVYGNFIVNEQTNEKEITKLVDKYANQLKDTYKGKKINVLAIKDGQVVQEQTIPVKESVVEKGQKLAKDLHAEVSNVIIGIYMIKIDLEETKQINATNKSQLILQLSEKDSIEINYKKEANAFVGTVQGNYTKDDILNSAISVK